MKDGALVVKVPAGEFLMGSPEGEGEPPEHPQRQVFVSEFLIDKTEVTWRQFRKFTEATGTALPVAPLWGMPDDYAVSDVRFDEAKAYCEWVGGRLPTEAEWEKAARGTDGRKYPWGNEWDPNRCNTFDGGPHRPEAVGSFPNCLSPYGLLDMAGGFFERCNDWYTDQYASGDVSDPKGPESGTMRVLRGGSWIYQPSWVRTAYRHRNTPDSRHVHHGFRCVQTLPHQSLIKTGSDSARHEIRKIDRVEKAPTVLVTPLSSAIKTSTRIVSLGKNDRGYEEYRREADGVVVVRIPAGKFLMGNLKTERRPLPHRVYVSEFLMDKTAVAWAQYKKFAQATGTPLPPHPPYWGVHDDHPAVFVTWEEAKAYCEWVGGRLPTEAEREKAARGVDGRMYPWGNEEPTPDRAVFRRSWGYEATDPVGTHPSGASPYGLLDMGGNVWEWCSDWYDDKYYEVSPVRNPKGPPSGQAHVVRGGSWDSRPSVLSASCRNWGYRGYREGDFGFRCAMDVPD